jgi:hypothetical protein
LKRAKGLDILSQMGPLEPAFTAFAIDGGGGTFCTADTGLYWISDCQSF